MKYTRSFGLLVICPFFPVGMYPAPSIELAFSRSNLIPEILPLETVWSSSLISMDVNLSGFFFPAMLILLLAGLAFYAWWIWKRWQADQGQLVKQEQHIRQLQEQHKEMERQIEQKNFLFSGLSHLLSETLDRLVKHAYMLQDDSASAGQKRASHMSMQETQQLLKLFMEDTQELSKLEHSQFHVQQETIELNQLLHELHAYALREKQEQERKDLSIHFVEADNNAAFYFRTDRQRMIQILFVLIRHSIRYTHHGSIDVSYQVLEHALQFTIEDTGLGFTSSEYTDLFHFFRQTPKVISQLPAERQMELILAGEIIHNMKGEISAQTNQQGGTRFILKLPFSPLPGADNAREIRHSQEDPTVYDWSGKTILVVEDSKMAYQLIHKMFSKSGATFDKEPNGIRAVERCQRDDAIDLVLMDIQLPLMDGYEATRKIKQIRPDLPVVAQTANALAGDRKRAMEAGCDEYIAKPIDVEEMGEKIDQILNPANTKS
ncbi:MAG TPA: response regulator [Bacteroidales bacterium]|nr:response regulator [Bacteroidales bacterium]